MSDRRFSPKCAQSGQRAVALATVPRYETQFAHDGRSYAVIVPGLVAPVCGNCGQGVIDDAADLEIGTAFRRAAGLLTPDEMLAHRRRLRLTQSDLADALGICVSTLCRWETGAQIQQRSLDRFLRIFFQLPAVRDFLAARDVPDSREPDSRRLNGTTAV